MTEPGADARSKSTHPRLTVALADAPVRARLSAGFEGPVVGASDLQAQAAVLAADRSADRAAARVALDSAAVRAFHEVESTTSRYERLVAGRDALLAHATWALDADADRPHRLSHVESARAVLDERELEQRNARAALERVLEQRATANAVMEDANRQLGDLAVVGMDESGLRRELEASGQAVRAAQESHAGTVAALAERRAEEAAAEQHRAALRDALAAHAASVVVDEAAVSEVAGAVQRWTTAAELASPDPDAERLAAALRDLQADRAELDAAADPAPDPAELEAAEHRAEAAGAVLERIETSSPAGVLTPGARAEIDAAHDAVLEAEEQAQRRIGGGAARKRLEELRAEERALLERQGFATYLDVMLTGGRRSNESPERLAAERELRDAVAARDALRARLASSPDRAYLDEERTRLLARASELLGVDAGDQAVELLRAHPAVPRYVVDELRDALTGAGLTPAGVALPDAARAWLDGQQTLRADHDRWADAARQAQAELDALDARADELRAAVAAAEHAEANAAEELELATRSVGAFEAELSMRADEDAKRLKRFAAAEQLRHQVEALSDTLIKAEAEARTVLDRATEAAAEAHAVVDRAVVALEDVARRARTVAAELPADERPTGDPLLTLPALAEGLRQQAEALAPEITAAEAAMVAATAEHRERLEAVEAAPTGAEGAMAEDVAEALRSLLDAPRRTALVLDDPFAGLDADARTELLDVVIDRSGRAPVVLLTEEADIVGWAIELPADVAAVVAADSLLNSRLGDADDQGPAAPAVDDADDTTAIEAPAGSAPRWAGRR